jgi:hypothetical protein
MSNVLLDSAIITKRNLIKLKRVPDLLFFATLSPIMFVLLFAYVFGSAIDVPGIDYKSFLMGGIFVQTMIFGASITGSSLAEDLQKGVMDRFRSLPMARSAVVIGRTAADVGNNVVTITIMSITGLIVVLRRSARLRAVAVVRVLDFVGDGAGRTDRALPGDLQQRVVHRDLPAHVHREHLRADRQLPERAQDHRGMEPHLVGDPGRA